MQTSRGCSSRGCSCLRSALPLARARTAPTKQTVQTIGGYGIPAIPTHPPNYLPTEPTETTEVSDARYSPTEPTEHTETTGARYSPTDCTDVHRLGGYGILPYPRRHQTIFPQKPTQPNHLWASVNSVGGSSPPKASVCSVNSVGGSSLPEASVNSVGEPYAAKPSVGICEICGRLFYARSFCEFRGFCGMIAMLVHECSVGAAETAAPPGRAAWVWQGCHTLLR